MARSPIEYLLDTNVVSRLVREPGGRATQRLERIGVSRVGTSIIAAAEIRFGYLRRGSSRLTRDAQAVLGSLPVLPFEEPADLLCARLRTELESAGTPIGANDMLIAAHALALDCTLVTANEGEFSRVSGLRVENWLA